MHIYLFIYPHIYISMFFVYINTKMTILSMFLSIFKEQNEIYYHQNSRKSDKMFLVDKVCLGYYFVLL